MANVNSIYSSEIYMVYARPRSDDFMSDPNFYDEKNWVFLGSYFDHEEAVASCKEHQIWRHISHSYIVTKRVTSYFPDTVQHLEKN